MDPIVKWLYRYLNQADKAPGYEPPIVITGVFYVIPNLLLFFKYLIK